jgi:hypothetical protein
MKEQYILNDLEKKKISDLIGTMERGLKKDFLDITNLIRSVQRLEGNTDCFRREKENCDQIECTWRQYCLERYLKNNE